VGCEGEARGRLSVSAGRGVRQPCPGGLGLEHRRMCLWWVGWSGVKMLGCRKAGRWWRRWCRAPTTVADRTRASTGGSGPSWSGQPGRGSWVSPLDGRATRDAGGHDGRGFAAHLTSPMRRVRCFSGRAAVTWRRHWSDHEQDRKLGRVAGCAADIGRTAAAGEVDEVGWPVGCATCGPQCRAGRRPVAQRD